MRRSASIALLVSLIALLLAACSQLSVPSVVDDAIVSRAADLIESNPGPGATCPDGVDGWIKIDASSGAASGAFGSFSYSGTTLTYSINAGYVFEFCIKYGPGYDIWQVTGFEEGTLETDGRAISHIAWRIVEEPPVVELQALTVMKTAEASFDREVEWELTKTVNGVSELFLNGSPGDEFELEWVITATKIETLGNYLVTGLITILNPNPVPVDVDVEDVLDDGTVADVDCGDGTASGTVPAWTEEDGNGVLECSYTAEPENDDAELNTATVEVTAYEPPENAVGEITGGEAEADVVWVENLIGDDEVTLADPDFDLEELISSSTTESFDDTWVCPTDVEEYDEDGIFCRELVNTATLTGENTDLEATASVKLTCQGLFGCTPGFWKQEHHFGHWLPTGYLPSDTIDSVPFEPSNYGSSTLVEALDFPGGGGVAGAQRILLRAAVASLLNFAHPDVNYAVPTLPAIQSEDDLIDAVNDALASGNRATMIALATHLDDANNAVNLCALDGQSFLD
jgi:hypothetical protein